MSKKYLMISMAILGICSSISYAEEENLPQTVSVNPVSVFNLNFNRQGNSIVARSGEKIFSTLNFLCNEGALDPEALYQIVIGYEGMGPQKCVFNELGYRFSGKEGIVSFFFEAPEEVGAYNVQCHVLSAKSSVEAVQRWWSVGEEEGSQKITIGKIFVK
jgi:hypothetical protein